MPWLPAGGGTASGGTARPHGIVPPLAASPDPRRRTPPRPGGPLAGRPYAPRRGTPAWPYAYGYLPAWGLAPWDAGVGAGGARDTSSEPADEGRAAPAPVVHTTGAGALPNVVERYVGRTKVIERSGGSPAPGAAGLVLAAVGDTLLRASWSGDSRPVREVSFFVADSVQRTLVRQTMTAAPFAALLPATRAAAYVGLSVTYADGLVTTTLVPYAVGRR